MRADKHAEAQFDRSSRLQNLLGPVRTLSLLGDGNCLRLLDEPVPEPTSSNKRETGFAAYGVRRCACVQPVRRSFNQSWKCVVVEMLTPYLFLQNRPEVRSGRIYAEQRPSGFIAVIVLNPPFVVLGLR